MTSAFAGSAIVVARWKYQAIGNASARLITIETNSSSAAPSIRQLRPLDDEKIGQPRADDHGRERLAQQRISTRNCAARVGSE